jgi:hypothetical protein
MVDENRAIRQDTLQVLYDAAGKGNDRITKIKLAEELAKKANDVTRLEFNLRWLQEKGYIGIDWATERAPIPAGLGIYPVTFVNVTYIRISSRGIDHIEEGSDFSAPVIKVEENQSSAQINVNGPNYGYINSVSGQGNTVTYNQQVSEAFKKAYSLVNSDLRFATEMQASEQLKQIQMEIEKKDHANKGKLQAGLEWLKEHTYEIALIVEPFVLKALGL